MRRPVIRMWILAAALAVGAATPATGEAQERLSGPERRVLRVNLGVSGGRILGVDADLGISERDSFVASARLWGVEGYGCIDPGPVRQGDGSVAPEPEGPPCTPEGWSVAAGLRSTAWLFFAQGDLGLYRYEAGQALMAPFAGLRFGLAPTLADRFELQLAFHAIVISSWGEAGFDPDSWFLGTFDLGLGIPIG